MSGALQRVADVQEQIPEFDLAGSPYPWSRPLQGLQARLRDVIRKLAQTPWTTSRTLTVTFTAGQTQVLQHGLGRTPVRWTWDDVITGDGTFRRTAWDANTISIRSANACTVVLRVE